MLTDDATLTYMKAGYLEGDMPSRDDALEMIDEIKRIRAELAAMTEQLDLANRRLGELAHAPIMDELNMLRKFFNDYGFNELAEAKRELARYKTPNVDNVTIKEIEK
jgi:uncharacterized protein related to proFAR isomerase